MYQAVVATQPVAFLVLPSIAIGKARPAVGATRH
jgi:hypothetical protein